MNTPDWKTPVSLGLSVVVGIAAVLIFRGCHNPRQTEADKLPPAVIKTMDSLDRTKPEFQQKQDSIIRVVVHDTVQAVALRKAEVRAKESADKAGRLADSLARVASTADEWHAAYNVRTLQVDSLHQVIAKADSVADSERHARQSLAVNYAADTSRRVVAEKLNGDLRDAIKKLEKPCRIIGPIPCPSRTASAGIALALGTLAGYKAK